MPPGSNRWGPVGGVTYHPSPLDRSDLSARADAAPRHLIKARADFGLDGKLTVLPDWNNIPCFSANEPPQMLVPGLERRLLLYHVEMPFAVPSFYTIQSVGLSNPLSHEVQTHQRVLSP